MVEQSTEGGKKTNNTVTVERAGNDATSLRPPVVDFSRATTETTYYRAFTSHESTPVCTKTH